MAVSYTAYGTTSLEASYKAGFKSPNYTYTKRRIFMAFDLTGSGLTAADVVSVELIMYCNALISGGTTVTLKSATGASGFGATIDATAADFTSTLTNTEDNQSISATGYYTFTVDKNNLDYNGRCYFRMTSDDEGQPATWYTGVTFSATEAGAPYQPTLRLNLLSGQVISVQMV